MKLGRKIAPLCFDCPYDSLCLKYGDNLWHYTCGDIYNVMYYWEAAKHQYITEEEFCRLLGIEMNHNVLVSAICENCGKEFYTKNPNRRFCSILCKLERNKKLRRENVKCQYCGKPLQTLETCFCSDQCRDKMIKASVHHKATLKNPTQPFLLGCWLNEATDDFGVSKNVLSKRLGVSPATMSKWCAGVNGPPRSMLLKLASLFNYDPYQLECMALDDEIVREVQRGGDILRNTTDNDSVAHVLG